MEAAARRHIFAIGGGAFAEGPGPLLVDYALSLARGARPRVCFLPTASGDSAEGMVAFYRMMSGFDCRPTDLRLFPRTVKDARGFLLGQDVIWVGGGSTANLLAVGRAHRVDQ